jgi:putative transposase
MRRFELDGHARFLTFSCYQRLPLLNHDGIRQLFLDRLAKLLAEQQVRLLGWVLMPEHAHLIVFPEADPDMRRFTHSLKRPVAEAVLRRWKQLGAPILDRLAHGDGYRFWQTGGGYDRNLTGPPAIVEKIEYVHRNPVRRGLVAVATDYPWSSARWYAGHPDAKLPCGPLPW